MIYGYLRVSTDEQDANSQKQGVDSFAKSKGLVIDEYIKDEGVSGAKDPQKRHLGPLLDKINKGDIIICSEISRLGRDLYMVMDILHYCMKQEAIIYTVKDNFTLEDNVQSKVLAFAFSLAAEIERQMIRQRTKEGLRMRMKMGVLLGRPIGKEDDSSMSLDEVKDKVIEQYNWGVPEKRLAENFKVNRNTIARALHRWGVKYSQHIVNAETKRENERKNQYKEGGYLVVSDIDRSKVIKLIEADLIVPQIAEQFPELTYEQVYDTILCDDEFNKLYRLHGQKKAVSGRKHNKQ